MAIPGELFRTNYGLPAEPQADSKRFRVRVYALYRATIDYGRDYVIDEQLRLWAGTQFERNGTHYAVERFD